MKAFNIYLTGVGGQGIGLISEMILRAADHAKIPVKSVDTHGLAQRGGIVVSQIRMGEAVHSPLIPKGKANLVISLERHEALRAAATVLQDKGQLIYYDTLWQPLSVRLDESRQVTMEEVQGYCRKRGIAVWSVFQADLPDIRMQNMVLLGEVHRLDLIPYVELDHYRLAMEDLMTGKMLEKNMSIFENRVSRS